MTERPQTLKNNQYVQKFDQGFVWQEWKFYMMRSWPCLFCSTSTAHRIRMLHWYSLFKEIYLHIGRTMSKFEETNNWSNFKSLDQSRISHFEKKITWAKANVVYYFSKKSLTEMSVSKSFPSSSRTRHSTILLDFCCVGFRTDVSWSPWCSEFFLSLSWNKLEYWICYPKNSHWHYMIHLQWHSSKWRR